VYNVVGVHCKSILHFHRGPCSSVNCLGHFKHVMTTTIIAWVRLPWLLSSSWSGLVVRQGHTLVVLEDMSSFMGATDTTMRSVIFLAHHLMSHTDWPVAVGATGRLQISFAVELFKKLLQAQSLQQCLHWCHAKYVPVPNNSQYKICATCVS